MPWLASMMGSDGWLALILSTKGSMPAPLMTNTSAFDTASRSSVVNW